MQGQSHHFEETVRSRYWQEQDAELILQTWQRSGLSLTAFADRWDVKASRLARWAKRLAIDEREAVFHPVRIVLPRPLPPQADWAADVRCGSQVVRVPLGFDADEVARLLRVVASC